MHITLIGMSGAGKSHVGKRLAAALSYQFYDVDRAMEAVYGKPLPAILAELGDEEFVEEQSRMLQSLSFATPHVIATGGSVIYTPAALECLKTMSKIIFIDAPLAVIARRVVPSNRGIVGLGDRTFAELYAERRPLYEQWADLTLCGDEEIESLLQMVAGLY